MIKVQYDGSTDFSSFEKVIKCVADNLSDAVTKGYFGNRKEIKVTDAKKYYQTLSTDDQLLYDNAIRIKNWQKKKGDEKIHAPEAILPEHIRNFLAYFNDDNQKEFWNVINAKASELLTIIDKVEQKSGGELTTDRTDDKKTKKSEYHRVLTDLFVTKGYKQTFAKLPFYTSTDLWVCPYCNHVDIYPKEHNGKRHVKGDLDHFYCKEKFPYLALTKSNLIPSCKDCNGHAGKHDKDLYAEKAISPLLLPHNHGIDFSIDLTGAASVKDRNELPDAIDINVKYIIPELANNDRAIGITSVYREPSMRQWACSVMDIARDYKAKPYQDYIDRTLSPLGLPPMRVSIESQFKTHLKTSNNEEEYKYYKDSMFTMSVFNNCIKTMEYQDNKKKIAVLLTVFNRRETTLKGLRSLYTCIRKAEDYHFDVFMTDDGCTDGTADAVLQEFPDVHVVQGDGNLYWSGGMRKAWEAALLHLQYDYYLWFNDDAMLFDNAFELLFEPINKFGNNIIVSGAFCNSQGLVSYGAYDKDFKLIEIRDSRQPFYLNGNLVLIPYSVSQKIGIISKAFKHSYGDWDYGCRARKNNIALVLTNGYVGKTERHDADLEPFIDGNKPLSKRLKLLYSIKCDTIKSFVFNCKHVSITHALKVIIAQHLYAIFPEVYKIKHK